MPPRHCEFQSIALLLVVFGCNGLYIPQPEELLFQSVRVKPQVWGSLDEEGATQLCSQLERNLDSGVSRSQMSPLKGAMLHEGGIDGLLDILEKYPANAALQQACLGAMESAIFYQEESQHYAGKKGLQRILVNSMRANIDNRDFVSIEVGNMGGFLDFCVECGDYAAQAGANELMVDILRKYKQDEQVVQLTLDGLTGNVYHSTDGSSRDKLYEAGLLNDLMDLISLYPYGPPGWLQNRQEVFAVVSGLTSGSPKQGEIVASMMKMGFPAECLKLMREQPTDQPSQSKAGEFIAYHSVMNKSIAQTFLDLGAIDHLVWAVGNYTTPTGQNASNAAMFWNADYSSVRALDALYDMVPSCRAEMLQKGVVASLIKAAQNPEGGYQTTEYVARWQACGLLEKLLHDDAASAKQQAGCP